MRVEVDRGRCESNALCMGVAPEVFSVGDDDVLVILDEEPPDELRDKVVLAVQSCPKVALRLID